MGEIIDFLDIMNVLFALMLCVVVDLEGTLGSHEVWIGLGVVVRRHLLSVES